MVVRKFTMIAMDDMCLLVAPVAQRYLVTLTRWDVSPTPANGSFLTCCCLHIKNRSDLYSVLSNIRTGPTDANASFRGHRLTTTQKGYT